MRKAAALDLAILGLLNGSPMHGYELRKHLNHLLGSLRAISFGALYPALKSLTKAGWISQTQDPLAAGPALNTRRARIAYALTDSGRARLALLLSDSGPEAWEDEGFGVRFAFFGTTNSDVRKRILEGRRSKLAERREVLRANLLARRERMDKYTSELQRHGLESLDRELVWLDELINSENDLTKPEPKTSGN